MNLIAAIQKAQQHDEAKGAQPDSESNRCFMKNITNNLIQYKKQIEHFLDALQSEKKYFNPHIDRIMKCELVIIEQAGNEIIAVAGLEKKLGIVRDMLIIKREFQRQGLGTKILCELINQTNKRHFLLMAVISEDNTASFRLHMKTGYKMIGNRQTLDYVVKPINRTGTLLYYLLKTLFPLLTVADIVRR